MEASNDLHTLKIFCPGHARESYYRDQPAVTPGNPIIAIGVARLISPVIW